LPWLATVGSSLIGDRFHLNEHLLSGQSCCTLGLFSPFSFGTLSSGFLTLGLLTLLCFSTLGLLALLGFNTLGLDLGLHLPCHVRHMTRHISRICENFHCQRRSYTTPRRTRRTSRGWHHHGCFGTGSECLL